MIEFAEKSDLKEKVKNIFIWLKYTILVLIFPLTWIRVGEYDKVWDKLLLEQLKDPHFSELKEHTVCLNDREIWIANYPYACCSDHKVYSDYTDSLPSRKTVLKFFKIFKKWKKKQDPRNENQKFHNAIEEGMKKW